MDADDIGKIDYLKEHIGSFPDFPKPGILFRDVFSLLQQPEAFRLLRDLLCTRAKSLSPPIDAVVGVDARGFLFAPIIALDLGIPFVPVRKKGKLPGKIRQATYQLEYGEDIVEIQETALKTGQRVLVVDDLIATGGSLGAACKLVTELGCTVSECLVVIELEALGGRNKLKGIPVHSFLQY